MTPRLLSGDSRCLCAGNAECELADGQSGGCGCLEIMVRVSGAF
jgi:hypothetical protein